MINEFIPYEEALALKELGFKEGCFGYYRNDDEILFPFTYYEGQFDDLTLAPLYQQAFRWFRDKHNLWEEVKVQDNVRLGKQKFYWLIFGEYTSYEGNPWVRAKADSNDVYYSTYEEAQKACLRKLIEIVKENL
jgi:hypothetical protein